MSELWYIDAIKHKEVTNVDLAETPEIRSSPWNANFHGLFAYSCSAMAEIPCS